MSTTRASSAIAVVDEDGLVDLERAVPVLERNSRFAAPEQRRQVRRVEVVGELVVLERLLGVAELVGGPRDAVVELVELLVVPLQLDGLAHQHVEDRLELGPALLAEVELRQRLAGLDVLGIELDRRGVQLRALAGSPRRFS